ncbi:MAG TPA: helix-turn-helix domain-containing protein [Streptosporangiaceae bacterium]|nr:helix-turn-helix domain-containing protein [Streptosporangiaceae bacterium]
MRSAGRGRRRAWKRAPLGRSRDPSGTRIAEKAGVSRATAQRYLTHLHDAGRVTVRLRYGASGRPEHGYCWYAGERR